MSDVKVTDSCGYDDERFDESPLAKQTAELLGRENNRCRITPEMYFDIVPWVMENMEQPLADTSAIVLLSGAELPRSIRKSVIPERVRMNFSADTICIVMRRDTAII